MPVADVGSNPATHWHQWAGWFLPLFVAVLSQSHFKPWFKNALSLGMVVLVTAVCHAHDSRYSHTSFWTALQYVFMQSTVTYWGLRQTKVWPGDRSSLPLPPSN